MKTPHHLNFNARAQNTTPKDDAPWVEADTVKKYPRSYMHLTDAMATIFEEAYIPMTISRQEEAMGVSLSAEDRKRMHDHYKASYVLSYYGQTGWSPLTMELRALGEGNKSLDYLDADCFSQHMIFDFFDDLEETAAGIRGIKSDMRTHSVTIESPAAFLSLIQALCAANPQITTSESYYEALTEHMSPEDREQSIDSGLSLLQMMQETGPDEGHISAERLGLMPSRPHSLMDLGMIFDAPDQYNQRPLFSMENLVAIVEEETGIALNHTGKPRLFMN